jgi:predicted negative regulator of RcsB-dependent stress response
MSSHLDLEEQEQIAELKHFWNRWGNLITWLLIAIMGGIAAWNGWQYWQGQQAIEASAMQEAAQQAATSGDWALAERAAQDLKDQYPRTHAASATQLMAAKWALDQQKVDQAMDHLRWVSGHSIDPGHAALARLRLAGVLLDLDKLDQARTTLTEQPPTPGFESLFEDRLGDLALKANQSKEAVAHYTNAYKHPKIPESLKQVVAVKLAALGVDADTLN